MLDPRKNLILFDLDGVIANDEHRVQYAINKEWGEYFSLIHKDTPLKEGVALAREYARRPDCEVQYLTGRRIDLYEETVQWLTKHGLPNPERITMRGFAHRSILARYKLGVLESALESELFASVHLYEDDPEVVRLANLHYGGIATLISWYNKKSEMVNLATS